MIFRWFVGSFLTHVVVLLLQFLVYLFLLLSIVSCTLTIVLFCCSTVMLLYVVFVTICFGQFFLESKVYWKQPLYVWGRGKVCLFSTFPRPHFVGLNWICCCCCTKELDYVPSSSPPSPALPTLSQYFALPKGAKPPKHIPQ